MFRWRWRRCSVYAPGSEMICDINVMPRNGHGARKVMLYYLYVRHLGFYHPRNCALIEYSPIDRVLVCLPGVYWVVAPRLFVRMRLTRSRLANAHAITMLSILPAACRDNPFPSTRHGRPIRKHLHIHDLLHVRYEHIVIRLAGHIQSWTAVGAESGAIIIFHLVHISARG